MAADPRLLEAPYGFRFLRECEACRGPLRTRAVNETRRVICVTCAGLPGGDPEPQPMPPELARTLERIFGRVAA